MKVKFASDDHNKNLDIRIKALMKSNSDDLDYEKIFNN